MAFVRYMRELSDNGLNRRSVMLLMLVMQNYSHENMFLIKTFDDGSRFFVPVRIPHNFWKAEAASFSRTRSFPGKEPTRRFFSSFVSVIAASWQNIEKEPIFSTRRRASLIHLSSKHTKSSSETKPQWGCSAQRQRCGDGR